jgi:hypothetical protein
MSQGSHSPEATDGTDQRRIQGQFSGVFWGNSESFVTESSSSPLTNIGHSYPITSFLKPQHTPGVSS